MTVTGGEFAERVADTDHRTAIKLIVRHTLAFDPAAIHEAIAILAAKPLLAA
jgi:hypothetical protein